MVDKKEVVTAHNVAEYFLSKSNLEGKSITNKKIQKLLYYSQAWSLVLKDEKLFEDKIEAWVHGPAIRSVYAEYKSYGFNPIDKDIDADVTDLFSDDQLKLLENVWSVYGKFDGNYLEVLSHSELPWQEAREGLEASESSDNEISLQTMKSYYASKLNRSDI